MGCWNMPACFRGGYDVNRKLLRGLEIVLAIVLVVSLVMVFRTRMEYARAASSYEEAASVVSIPELISVPLERTAPEEDETPEENEEAEAVVHDPNLVLLAELNIDLLRQENPDVLGWICIPDTVVSYPLLQNQNNEYYLGHSWKKERNMAGSVFMDYRSNADLTDFHTVIFGHRMNDGSMFGTLRDYRDIEHWQTHPSVYIVCAGGAYRYDIFAAYEASVSGHVFNMGYRDVYVREAFINSCLEQSVIDTGIVPTEDDRILTLSTCTGRGYEARWVVQAVLAEFYAGDEDVSGLDLDSDM